MALTFGSILGISLGVFIFRVYLLSGRDTVIVPEVSGLECQLALKRLKDLEFRVTVKGKGLAVGTSPRAGMAVREGRDLELFCSEKERVDPEFVKGSYLHFALDALKTLGLDVRISRIHLKNEDQILDYKMEDGTVYLLVDSGPPPKYVSIPDFRGMRVSDATRLISSLGISFSGEGDG